MPKTGHKSVTIPQKVYDFYEKQWQKHKEEWQLKGINSFSSYLIHILNVQNKTNPHQQKP